MSIRLNWDELREKYEDITQSSNMHANSSIIFTMITADHKIRKSSVKLQNFMKFVWSLSENHDFEITTLLAQDEEGRVLYRYKQLNADLEQVPTGGNASVITHWNTMTPTQKEFYIRLIVSQIQSYEQ